MSSDGRVCQHTAPRAAPSIELDAYTALLCTTKSV